VDGHSGDPLHNLANRLAVEAAADEEADTIFDNEVRAELSVAFEGKPAWCLCRDRSLFSADGKRRRQKGQAH
jgi:hypothetical protein